MTDAAEYALLLSCADQPGIVAAIANTLYGGGCNIIDSKQYSDAATGRFFMRVIFGPTSNEQDIDADAVRTALTQTAEQFAMTIEMRDRRVARRVMLMVSSFDHCLTDILYRWRLGEFAMEPVGVISNHPRSKIAHLDLGDIPFHHLPVTKQTKLEQESDVWRAIRESGAELVVLARYMQILTDGLAAKLAGRCINIHHSFLPGFKGAKPYHQAHARGVKLIGATAHFVTSDLDEGPIIEQGVERISHSDAPETLVRKGRDIERRVLSQAIGYFLDDRIFLNGQRTVVFPD